MMYDPITCDGWSRRSIPRIARTVVDALAGQRSPRALIVAADGGIGLVPVDAANPDEIVGVYWHTSQLPLAAWIADDVRFVVEQAARSRLPRAA